MSWFGFGGRPAFTPPAPKDIVPEPVIVITMGLLAVPSFSTYCGQLESSDLRNNSPQEEKAVVSDDPSESEEVGILPLDDGCFG
jgi:hypothetical protein